MQKDRFWFGTFLVAAPALLCLMLVMPRIETRRGGPLEGQVKIHGRPMAGGFIVFVPDDPKANAAVGAIDEKGHYEIESRWLRENAKSQAHFRICLIPKPGRDDRNVGIEREPARLGDAGGATEHDGLTTIATVASKWPRRLSDPKTSHLEVEIGPEPTRVDITL